MSDENIEQQNDMSSYSEVEDKYKDEDNNLHLDNSSYSKTFNHLNTNDNFNNKLLKTNILNDTSQLNKTECKYLVNICNKYNFEFANLNSQDEKLITKITEKNLKHIFTTGDIAINTQQFINLNIQKAIIHLQLTQSNLDTCKNQSIKHLNSDDLIDVLPYMSNELRNVEKNVVLTGDELNKLDKDLKLSNYEPVSKLSKQEQNPEIIAFREMCKAIIQIGVTDNSVMHDNINSTVIIKDQMKQIIFKQVNTDELKCINYKDCAPSISKSKSSINSFNLKDSHDNFKQRIAYKRRQSPIMYLSSDDSSDNLNELSQSKKIKYTKIIKKNPNHLNLHSDNTIQPYIGSNKINLFVITSSEDEEDILTKNEISRITNYKHNINEYSIAKNKILKKVEPIFRCSPNGFIHAEMLNSIRKNNCTKKYNND